MRFKLHVLFTALVGITLAWTQTADAMQIGAKAPGPGLASKVRGKIYEPSAFINGTYGRTYWIYATFPNGTFIQAGVLDADNQYNDLCQTGFSTFVVGLDDHMNNVFNDLYNNGHCNLTGAHFFTLSKVAINPPQSFTWQWSLDGNPLGPKLTLPWSQGEFHRGDAGAITEIVKVGNIPSNLPLPTVRYDPAIEFVTPNSGGQWIGASGEFVASSDRICQYALRVDNDNNFSTGLDSVLNPAHCHSTGDTLW